MSGASLAATTATPAQTEELGARLAARLVPGDLIALRGPLGAGKTVFVRGLAAGRGVDPALVKSPTFVLHHVYGSPPRLHHLDLYRLGPAADIALLDLDSLLDTAPAAVEWGDHADLGPWNPLRLSIEIVPAGRRLEAVSPDLAPERLVRAFRDALGP